MILLLAATAPSTLAALLAIDYGAEWTKASLVKPGTPFDVLLDKGRLRRAGVPEIHDSRFALRCPDSKRKMMSTVGWKKDERVFGGDAANMVNFFPYRLVASID